MWSFRFILCCLAFVLSSAAPAFAQPDERAAEKLFHAGRKAMKEGNHELACQRFRESLAIEATIGTRINLAICEEELGNLVRAWELHTKVLQDLETDDTRAAISRDKLKSLDDKLGRITFELAKGAPTDTVVHQASTGRALNLHSTIAVLPGVYDITVSAVHHESKDYSIEVGAGQVLTLSVLPGAEIEEPSSAPPVAPPPKRRAESPPRPASSIDTTTDNGARKTWGYATLAIGGGFLAVSGVAAGVVMRAKTTVDEECGNRVDGMRPCTQRGLDAADRGKLYSNIATIAFAIGVAGAGTGAVLLLWGDSGTENQLTATVTPAGLMLRGRF